MKALLTGASGQLGKALVNLAPEQISLDARTHAQLDLLNAGQVTRAIDAARPDVVINAAAYTAVDKSESEHDAAFALNAAAVATLARACRDCNAKLIHVSTDYVFSGDAVLAREIDAPTQPANVYGASKFAGERLLAETTGLRWSIVRTSWLYAPWGGNFVLTMLRLMRERGAVNVVCDQIGAPTSALNLARFIWQTIARDVQGILHYCDAGVASWYDFAVAINEEATALGLLPTLANVHAIATAQYPTAAKRPAMSLLATQSSLARVPFAQPHWRAALREVLRELPR